jgi:serine/threonine-protein kinase
VLEPGVVLSGRYRLDERVATGGMGDVWRATDTLLGRTVAVKVLLPSLVADPGFIARFRAEARMMAALHSPGVVQVYDVGEDTLAGGARADYLVMEYVAGQPLSQRLTAAGRLGVTETMSVVAQAARALHAAHRAGIVHRDVKPSNLLIQPDGTVVLVDFGVARSTAVTSITGTNAVPGTALYMAPEQALGKPVSAATDIYALGTVAYHCLAGQTPFTGNNPLEVAVKHTQDEPPPLPDDIPQPVRALVGRALAKDPTDRHPDAETLAEAAVAAGGGTTLDTSTDGVAVSATTALVAAGSAAAGSAAVPGVGRDAGTLTDLPAVASHPPRYRAAAVTLVAVVLAFTVAGLAVAFNLDFDPAPPAEGPAPTSRLGTPSVSPGGDEEDDEDEDPDRSRPDTRGSITRSDAPDPTPPRRTPTPDPEPSSRPSGEPPTTAPTDANPTPDEDEPTEPGNPPGDGADTE